VSARGLRIGALARGACLLAGMALFLLPLYVVVVTAAKPLDEIIRGTMLAPPRHWTIAPLAEAWSSACIGAECAGLRRGFLNSVAIAVPASCISVLLGAVNGYALTKWRLPGAHALFVLLLAANFIPYQMVLLPVAVMLRELGLFGTLQGLVLVHVAYGMPYVTLLFRNFYMGLPADLVQAARLDGGRFWPIFLHIVLPLSGPMLATALMLQFSAIWNDYLFGLVFGGRNAPVTVALDNLINAQLGAKQYDVNMAGVLLVALPALLLYLFAGRWFLRHVAAGPAR
jgi:glucose/mannose transport system permease protein